MAFAFPSLPIPPCAGPRIKATPGRQIPRDTPGKQPLMGERESFENVTRWKP